MRKYECKVSRSLRYLIRSNEQARTNTDPDLKNSHHKVCGEYVKFLMEKKCGVVSKTFRHLFDLGEGKPGDDICLLTHEYATLLLKEESSKDINDILSVERIEKRVRERIEEKLNS